MYFFEQKAVVNKWLSYMNFHGYGNVGDCTCSYDCGLDLRCADMQSAKENPQQEGGGNYRSYSICARCFCSYCARPDSGTHINRHGEQK